MKTNLQHNKTHSVHDVCMYFEQFLAAQEITKNIMENFGAWVSFFFSFLIRNALCAVPKCHFDFSVSISFLLRHVTSCFRLKHANRTQTEYVRNISDDANENKEIASFFSSIITNLFRLNDNLKQTISNAKSILNARKTPDFDRNAALLKRLMECAVDETDCHVNDNLLYTNYATYDDGYIGLGFVSHISDVKNSICFILDVDRMPDSMLFYGSHLKPLNRLPETGEIFAYHLNQKFLFRAIRCATSESEAIAAGRYQYYAKFIDVGSTMWIDTTNGFHNHYELDESVQQIPGFALKCQIVQMPTNYNLLNILHDKVSFRILKIGNSIVYVELLSQSTNPFLCLDEVGGNNKQLYSYFTWNDPTSFDPNKNVGIGTNIRSPSQRIESSLSSRSCTSINHSYALSSDCDKAVGNHFMEMINTTTISKADITKKLTSTGDSSATNWNAHENRMQQFADTLSSDDENVYDSYGNVTTSYADEEPSVPKIRLPCIGDTVSISASFVIDVERFYAFIPSCLSSTTKGVKQLHDEMNADHNRRNYQPLHLTPPINGHVFAIYRNFVYRARVIAHYDQMNYQVFYIDYGNCAKVNLNELFKWDSRWDDVPAQIFLCRLHGMRKIRFFDFEAMTALEGLLVNKTLKAKVTNIIDTDDNNSTIVLSVRDIHDIDVTETMCEKNFAKPI